MSHCDGNNTEANTASRVCDVQPAKELRIRAVENGWQIDVDPLNEMVYCQATPYRRYVFTSLGELAHAVTTLLKDGVYTKPDVRWDETIKRLPNRDHAVDKLKLNIGVHRMLAAGEVLQTGDEYNPTPHDPTMWRPVTATGLPLDTGSVGNFRRNVGVPTRPTWTLKVGQRWKSGAGNIRTIVSLTYAQVGYTVLRAKSSSSRHVYHKSIQEFSSLLEANGSILL